MSEHTSEKSGGEHRIDVLRIVATAVSGVAIAVVGIIPQISALRSQEPHTVVAAVDAVDEKWSISGEFSDGEDRTGFELFLIPQESGNYTDDQGKFVFGNVADGAYWFVVRSPAGTIKTLVEVGDGAFSEQGDFATGKLSYTVQKQPSGT